VAETLLPRPKDFYGVPILYPFLYRPGNLPVIIPKSPGGAGRRPWKEKKQKKDLVKLAAGVPVAAAFIIPGRRELPPADTGKALRGTWR